MRISKQTGSASFNFFAALFFIATVAFFIFVLCQPKNSGPPKKDLPAALRDARFEKLEGEISQFAVALDGAETMRSRRKYLEIVGAAEDKLIEADDLLDEALKTQKGLVDGMMGGLNENYEARFTRADKFEMLSKKYGLPVEKLRRLKANFELMFLEEFVEKFSAPNSSGTEQQKEEGPNDTSQ